jgi:exonuclease III
MRIATFKAPGERFPAHVLRAVGYESIRHGQKSCNGVAILSRCPSVVARSNGRRGHREVRGREKASDHAPVWIEIEA